MTRSELVHMWIKKHARMECLSDPVIFKVFKQEIEYDDDQDQTLVSAEGSVHSVKLKVPKDVPVVNDNIDPSVPDFKDVKASSPANSQSKKSECLVSRFIRARN